VELALFRRQPGQDWPVLVQPRVVARTAEVTRAVVDVQAPDDVNVTVELPEEEDDSSGRQTLTEAAFYDQLAENTSPSVAEDVRDFVDELTDLGPERVWRSSSVSLRLPDPGGLDQHWTVIVLRTEGTFRLGWLNYISEKGEYDPDVWQPYREDVVSMTGAAPKKDGATEPESIERLLQNRSEYVEVVRRFVDRLRTAADA